MIRPLRALHVLLACVGVAMLGILVVVLAAPHESGVPAMQFAQAQLCTQEPLTISHDRAGFEHLLALPLSDRCEQTVSLPHQWHADGIKLTRNAVEPMARAVYRIDYRVPDGWADDDRLMIYSPRILGVAWQARVNDEIVADNLDDWRMTPFRSLAATMHARRLHAGDQMRIAIVVAFEPGVGYGLGHVSAGPVKALASRVSVRRFLQYSVPIACNISMLVIGAFFLLFWLLRRRERMHLLLALSCMAWCVSNLSTVLPRRDDATLDAWYSAITGPSISWAMWFVYLFVMQLDRRFSRAVANLMPPFVLAMSWVGSPLFPLRLNEDVGVLYQGANVVMALAITARIAWVAIDGGSIELRVIAAALVVAIAAGIHDWALIDQRIDPEDLYLFSYSSMIVFGAFLFAVQRRYVHAINEHERLGDSLAQRLSEREVELEANHRRVRELERIQTLATERQRLMQDMHDGLGSALTASLAMLERGKVNAEELRNTLRDSIDDLRAVIDSLEPIDGDLISVLATLRFRLGKRLESAGIDVVWEMTDLPPLTWLGSPQALQVTRIVQETLTNILKHAAATQVTISSRQCGKEVEVCIADNGGGFDVARETMGRGLRHLTQRAASIDGRVRIDSSLGAGTAVTLFLPVSIEREFE